VSLRPDTIAAVATAPGRGGIGVVRVSGPLSRHIANAVAGPVPPPRHAAFRRFRAASGAVVDEGLVLYFAGPRSYTGEDVIEFQGHGGPVVLREIVRHCLASGARLAEPGEFTKRAFLNERLDLAQAEGVADLIDAASVEAARGAARSLSGEFSQKVKALAGALVDLRLHVEACIDFPEEDIDPADRQAQMERLAVIRHSLDGLLEASRQGALLREGLTVVLAGRPNVGKSSILNCLAGEEVAIVTPVPGTTRDFVRASILVEGVPVHLIDTAGLRESGDEVERLGIARAWEAIAKAGAVMLVTDEASSSSGDDEYLLARMPPGIPVGRVLNKIDLLGLPAGREARDGETVIRLSARTGDGIEALRGWLLNAAGWQPQGDGIFLARERHLAALRSAARELSGAAEHPTTGELFAEDLRQAQRHLGKITGEVTADDLLGEIFSRFCIGK
jgi:tRNA modification GTPase